MQLPSWAVFQQKTNDFLVKHSILQCCILWNISPYYIKYKATVFIYRLLVFNYEAIFFKLSTFMMYRDSRIQVAASYSRGFFYQHNLAMVGHEWVITSHKFLLYVITYTCPNFNDGCAMNSMKLMHGWVNTPRTFMRTSSMIQTQWRFS